MFDIDALRNAVDDCNKHKNDMRGIFITAEEANDILAILKEQEAVAPNPVHNSFRWFACGKCDCSITKEDRFCPRCGQAVKWND